MEGSWRRTRNELDESQQKIMLLPLDGRYLIVGPPGSGKTNLLLLRANYLYGSRLTNVLFLTLARSLVEFIQTGVGRSPNHIPPEQIMTMRKWATKMGYEHARAAVQAIPGGSYEQTRKPF